MNKIFKDKALMERLQVLSVNSIAALGVNNQLEAAKEELDELMIELNRYLVHKQHKSANAEQFRLAAIMEMADVFQTLFHCWNVFVKDVFDEQIFLNKLHADINNVQGLINNKIKKDGE